MKKTHLIWIIPLVLIILLFFIRLFSHVELDDVTPGIPCDDSLIQNSGVLWIVPNFENHPIENDTRWCTEILNLNKTLGMHGIKHTYWEFEGKIVEKDLEYGRLEFKRCFGFFPDNFKPPQLKITPENKELIKKFGMDLKLDFNQITHKVYHCNDSDFIKNKWVKIF